MSDITGGIPSARWTTLNQEVQSMEDSLMGFTLVGAQDREANHIAAMQEEIDQKTREALVVYWLDQEEDEFPRLIA